MTPWNELLKTILDADATLVGTALGTPPGTDGWSGLLKGGIWTRALKREGEGSTPYAFWTGTRGEQVRPSMVIIDQGENAHRQSEAIPHAYEGFIYFYFYAPALASGKTAIRSAQSRIYDLVHDRFIENDGGPLGYFSFADRLGIRDSEEFYGAVYDYCRYTVVSRFR